MKNAVYAIMVSVAAFLAIQLVKPDKELLELQKENLKLQIELMKQELKQ